MTIDELAARIEQRFEGLEQKLDSLEQKFGSVEQKVGGFEQNVGSLGQNFGSLEQKMDEGFEASKVRDEELRGLMAFGLEAREVLRDEMHRRFDAAGHKHDEQIGLLKDVIRQNLAKP